MIRFQFLFPYVLLFDISEDLSSLSSLELLRSPTTPRKPSFISWKIPQIQILWQSSTKVSGHLHSVRHNQWNCESTTHHIVSLFLMSFVPYDKELKWQRVATAQWWRSQQVLPTQSPTTMAAIAPLPCPNTYFPSMITLCRSVSVYYSSLIKHYPTECMHVLFGTAVLNNVSPLSSSFSIAIFFLLCQFIMYTYTSPGTEPLSPSGTSPLRDNHHHTWLLLLPSRVW